MIITAPVDILDHSIIKYNSNDVLLPLIHAELSIGSNHEKTNQFEYPLAASLLQLRLGLPDSAVKAFVVVVVGINLGGQG